MECTVKVVARMHSNQFFCREFICPMTDILPVPSTEVSGMIRREMQAHIVSQKFVCATCQSLMLGVRPMSLAPSKAVYDGSYLLIEECADIFCIPCRYTALPMVGTEQLAEFALATENVAAQRVVEHMAAEQRVIHQRVSEQRTAAQRMAAQIVTERMAAEQRATQSV